MDEITIDPEICNEKPIIRGEKITAQTILEFISAGESHQEILAGKSNIDCDMKFEIFILLTNKI